MGVNAADIRRFNRERLAMTDLAENTSTRMPICLCVDSSYSMCVGGKIDRVNAGIKSLIRDFAKNIYSQDSVDLCIVCFDGKGARVEGDFSKPADLADFKTLVPDRNSPLAPAVKLSLDKIEERVELYRNANRRWYRPTLIIISDGACDDEDDCRNVSHRVKNMVNNHKLNVICVGFGGDQGVLGYFADVNKITDISSVKGTEFFSYLSKSVEKINTSRYLYSDDDVLYTL